MTPEQAQYFAQRFEAVVGNVERFIQGKDDVVRLALTSLLAEGHLLMEDVPGVGKTSLARSLSASLGLSGSRIQFTPDLLPSDVTGVTVFHQSKDAFEFHPGPVFANIVLADEISPDCCRLWDVTSGDKLDKDRIRRDLGGVLEAYTEVARRLGVLTENPRPKGSGPVLVSTNGQKPN